MADQVISQGEVQRGLPGLGTDGVTKNMRVSRRGELINAPLFGNKSHGLADEGSYFVATNPTAGTGVAGIAAADGFDALETLVFLRNTEADKRIYLDYIMLVPTAAGTNGTNFNYAMNLDKGSTRYASGGSAITPKNVNAADSSTMSATLYVGAVVTTAATAEVRKLGSGLLRNVIKVIGDRYVFDFGSPQKVLGGTVVSGTAPANIVIPCAPVVLGQNDSFLLHEWAASQTVAASYEFEIGFWVR